MMSTDRNGHVVVEIGNTCIDPDSAARSISHDQ
jgi:hypothetical protein